jgi:hypothetical protein
VAWEETRGSTSVAVASARQVAHADDAKSRVDEASRLPTRSLRPRVLVGAGVGLAVLGLVAFLVLRGGDEESPEAAAPEPTSEPTGAAPAEQTAAEVLAGSVPSGEWRVVQKADQQIQRNGASQPFKAREENTWTFPAADCSDAVCSGVIQSSSGRTFAFSWNGRKLDVTRTETVSRDKKRACIDRTTGEVLDIAESAARVTYRYSYSPLTGTPDRMTGKQTTRISYEFFGTCTPGPTDIVRYTYKWTMTPAEPS